HLSALADGAEVLVDPEHDQHELGDDAREDDADQYADQAGDDPEQAAQRIEQNQQQAGDDAVDPVEDGDADREPVEDLDDRRRDEPFPLKQVAKIEHAILLPRRSAADEPEKGCVHPTRYFPVWAESLGRAAAAFPAAEHCTRRSLSVNRVACKIGRSRLARDGRPRRGVFRDRPLQILWLTPWPLQLTSMPTHWRSSATSATPPALPASCARCATARPDRPSLSGSSRSA